MCYSAQIWQDYRRYTKKFGVQLHIKEFVDLFWHRLTDRSIKVPKAMEAAFAISTEPEWQEVRDLIEQFARQETTRLEQDLFQLRKRLADAERALQVKPTKTATENRRIATNKIDWTMDKLSDLRRSDLRDRDSRIYPGVYAPVMVMEEGRRVIKPMRYQCRPAGKPAFYDTKYPGTYNARRDNLEGFWKTLFGHAHGLMVVNAFYENVTRPDGNVVLEFQPTPTQDMLVACLWSCWTAPGEPDLLSFAAITDEPPAEVAAAGHDRCIVPIKAENIDAWLRPDAQRLADQYAILDDRARPFYEHRLAA